jgi:hypothetical protein
MRLIGMRHSQGRSTDMSTFGQGVLTEEAARCGSERNPVSLPKRASGSHVDKDSCQCVGDVKDTAPAS